MGGGLLLGMLLGINHYVKQSQFHVFGVTTIIIATNANNTDFTNIAGSMVTEGIPNKKLLTSGERTAVNIPTLNPYL